MVQIEYAPVFAASARSPRSRIQETLQYFATSLRTLKIEEKIVMRCLLALVAIHFCFGKLTTTKDTISMTTTNIIQQPSIPTNNSTTNNNPHNNNALLTHPDWCPKARCHNSILCQPCTRRFLIVITTPRSASTTLTWMLDALPGITMGGENNGALGKLKTLQDNVIGDLRMNSQRSNNNGQNHSAWHHHKFIDQSFSCVSQDMIRFLNPPILQKDDLELTQDPEVEAREIVGFKTIRFFDNLQGYEDVRGMAQWLLDNFPCARYIININSDVAGTAASVQKSFVVANLGKSRGEIKDKIVKQVDQGKQLYQLMGQQRAYLLDKLLWTAGGSRKHPGQPGGDMKHINDMVEWLGFDKSCEFEELLEYNTHGRHGKDHGNKTTVKPFPETCVAL